MERYSKLEIRLTEEEKQAIKIYAAKQGKTMSEIVRDLCYEIFNKKEEK